LNIRVVTYLSSEDEEEIKDFVADVCEALIRKGFANEIEDTSKSLKSIIVVKENVEVLESSPEEFFNQEFANSLLTVIPTDEKQTEETTLIKIEEEQKEDND